MIELRAGLFEVSVDAETGGRLASVRAGGTELLVGPTPGAEPLAWGCYPMAPYAGRVCQGRFTFEGLEHQLPLRLPPHAIHGTVFERPWDAVLVADAAAILRVPLGPDWPWSGYAVERFAVRPDGVRVVLEVHADAGRMPASAGFHPWFRRHLEAGGPAVWDLDAEGVLLRGADGLPTGEVADPGPLGAHRWDDCFVGVRGAPVLRWPGAWRVELVSRATDWVVYDEQEEGLCLEPQTAPPDALRHEPAVVEPGRPLVVDLLLRISPDVAGPAGSGDGLA